MAISKIQSKSINLADDFTFTGTVAGAGKILQVLNATSTTETVMNNDPVGLHSPHFNEDQIKHLLL